MSNPTQHAKKAHSRRSYLKGAGVALSALAFTGTASAATTEYDQVVNIVEAGADPTGEELIDDVLEEYNEDNTRIEFPDGRYLTKGINLYKRENFAMVGTGDATLVPPDGFDEENWIAGGFVRNIRFENFTIDNTAPNTVPSVGFGGWDGIVVKDIYKKGYHDGDKTAFGISAWDPEGHALVENLRMPDGGQPRTAVGVYVDTAGTVTFRDCHVEGFGNNGIYASSSDGPVHVEGGTFKNNDIAQVRLGSPESYVRDAEVVVEDPPDHLNCRGVRVSDGHGPVTIDNCDIRMVNGKGGGAVVGAFSGGGFHLKNSRLYVGPDYTTVGSGGSRGAPAVFVDEPSYIDDPGGNVIENTAITGSGTYRSALRFYRDNNTIRNVCIHQTGDARNGVVLKNGSTNNTLEDSNVNVTGSVTVANDGDIDVRNVSWTDACPYPAGVEVTTSAEEPLLPFTEAPVPGNANSRTYAVAGTGNDAPVADVYLGFGTHDDQLASLEAIPRLLAEYADSGGVTVRYRPYGLYDDRSKYLATMLQGVWDIEPGKFWRVFGWTYRNHEDYTLDSWDDGRTFLDDAGVRNYAKIPALALRGDYDDTLADTVDYANQLDYKSWDAVPADYPCLTMNGDLTWLARNDRDQRDDLVDWIAERL